MSVISFGNIAGTISSNKSFGQYNVNPPFITLNFTGPNSKAIIPFITLTTSPNISLSSTVFTVVNTGLYLLDWNFTYGGTNFSNNPSYQIQIYVNNILYLKGVGKQSGGSINFPTGGNTSTPGSTLIYFNAGDVFSFYLNFSVNSGSAFSFGVSAFPLSQISIIYLGTAGANRLAAAPITNASYTVTSSPQLFTIQQDPISIYGPYISLNNNIFTVLQAGRYSVRYILSVSGVDSGAAITTFEPRCYVNGVYSFRGPLFQTSNSCCFATGGIAVYYALLDMKFNENDTIYFAMNVITSLTSFSATPQISMGTTFLYNGIF